MPALRSPLRPAIRSALRSPLDPAISSGGAFSPLSLFTGGELGLWFDPSDIATLYQDSAGTTPVTAVTQPVGKVNDKSGRGNHAFQATTAARPLLSARVNLLTKTDSFDTSVWFDTSAGFTTKTYGQTDPLGGSTAVKLVGDSASTYFTAQGGAIAAGDYTLSMWLRADAPVTMSLLISYGTTNALAVSITTSWQRFSIAASRAASPAIYAGLILDNGSNVYVWHPQLEAGPVATRYQQVNTATDYDTVGFPVYDSFDGVDDALATGAITLGSDMDCFIAVRRNSSANLLLAYGDSVSKNFGITQSGNFGVTSTNAGTPTLAVNGVSISGGTSATCDQLHQATPSGSWSVVETRNLDLSLWTEFKFGRYLGYQINGDIGGIILAPAQSTASRNQIRTYLGAKVGLVL